MKRIIPLLIAIFLILPVVELVVYPAPDIYAASKQVSFVGIPTSKAQLLTCMVVGNYTSMIYHTKGSSYIPQMSLAKKRCFATEKEAVKAGFRKSKTR